MSTTSKNPAQEKLAKKIRFLLQNESLTINKLADRLGVSKDHLRDVVDARSRPTRHLIQRLCGFFEVKPEFFGKAVHDILWDDPTEDTTEDEKAKELRELEEAASRNFAAEKNKSGSPSVTGLGIVPKTEKTRSKRGSKKSSSKKKRKFDLAELAVHYQALLECLLEKKVLSSSKYSQRIEDVRKRTNLE